MLHSSDRKISMGYGTQEVAKVPEGILHPVSDLELLPYLIIARIIHGPLPTPLLNELLALHKLRERVFSKVLTGGISRFWISSYLPLSTNRLLSVRTLPL